MPPPFCNGVFMSNKTRAFSLSLSHTHTHTYVRSVTLFSLSLSFLLFLFPFSSLYHKHPHILNILTYNLSLSSLSLSLPLGLRPLSLSLSLSFSLALWLNFPVVSVRFSLSFISPQKVSPFSLSLQLNTEAKELKKISSLDFKTKTQNKLDVFLRGVYTGEDEEHKLLKDTHTHTPTRTPNKRANKHRHTLIDR